MIKVKCNWCEKTIFVYPYRIRSTKNGFGCSKQCRKKYGYPWHRREKNYQWTGKTYNRGYRYIYKPEHPSSTQTGYVLEHRLMMEKKLGRLLKPSEIIHHKNEKKLDNHASNLVITTRKEHIRTHNPVQFR